MTTHVFVVDEQTFKYHLEYMFAGTGANDKKSTKNATPKGKKSLFLTNPNIVIGKKNAKSTINANTERSLVSMIADISRVNIGDKVIFYVQATKDNPGRFFGVFKVVSNPFFDENNSKNYLRNKLKMGLSFRVKIDADSVYPEGISEHDYLDSLKGKFHPYDLCWSLIYRKLKGNRGCTMIMDYEYYDFLIMLQAKNVHNSIISPPFTYKNNRIVRSKKALLYNPDPTKNNPQLNIDILPRLQYLFSQKNKSFETHLQAYIIQNLNKTQLSNLLIPYKKLEYWIGNEVSCGVGMQRIDLMIKQETQTDIVIRLIELKDEAPRDNVLKQINWYLEWLSDYVVPKYNRKRIRVIPTIIANGGLSPQVLTVYQTSQYNIPNVNVVPLQYIGFNINQNTISFTRYL